MPLFLAPLVTWLGGAIFTALYWFVQRKGILFAAFLLIIGLVGTAITLLINQIDSLIGGVLPANLGLIAPFVPDNMAFCLSSIVTAHLACTGYRLTMKFIRWKATVMMA